jgi:acetolactate synthase I/II/III large subunit
LQDISHTALAVSITRYARTLRHAHEVPREIDAAIAVAMGHSGEPGPAFIDLPVDVQRELQPAALCAGAHIRGVPKPRTRPFDADIQVAADLIAGAERPVVISAPGANTAADALADFLTASGAAYLDTGETKGIVPEGHPAHVAAMRGRAMTEADLVVTVGRRLGFQLAYGSEAVFGAAHFVRISDVPQEFYDNRLGDVALLGDVRETLTGLTERLTGTGAKERDRVAALHAEHVARTDRLASTLLTAKADAQGLMHPIRLLGALRERLGPAEREGHRKLTILPRTGRGDRGDVTVREAVRGSLGAAGAPGVGRTRSRSRRPRPSPLWPRGTRTGGSRD